MSIRIGFLLGLMCFAEVVLASEGTPPTAAPNIQPVEGYRLGPQDEITVHILDLDGYQNGMVVRVDETGEIDLPVIGRVSGAGKTIPELEADLRVRLKDNLLNPQVSATISSFRSQPVSILGAVTTPGVHQVEGGKKLYEVVSLAGGLRIDAGAVIKITRRKENGPIPLPGATLDSSGQFMIAEVSVKSMTKALNPMDNILIRPYDVISIPFAEVIYVVGAVHKAGVFPLGDKDALSVLQVLAMAEGLEHLAAPKKAKILRKSAQGGERTEIAVNIKEILQGQASDVSLGPNDVLFIPNVSGVNGAVARTADIMAQAAAMGLALHY